MNDQDSHFMAQQCINALADIGALTVPIDIGLIANLCGIRLINDPQLIGYANGISFKIDGVNYAAIAPIINTPLQRWCAAHEIGHILLGHLDLPWCEDFELKADLFAAEVLMPDELIDDIRYVSRDDIERLFCVPSKAAYYKVMGYLSRKVDIDEYIVCS